MRDEEGGYPRIRALKCMRIRPYSHYFSRAAAGLVRASEKKSHPQPDALAVADGLTDDICTQMNAPLQRKK
jgi:hypothetical protein